MKKNIFKHLFSTFIFFIFSEAHCDMQKKDHAFTASDIDILSFFEVPSIALRATAPETRAEDFDEEEMKLLNKLEEQERSSIKIAKSIWRTISRFERNEIRERKFMRKINHYANRISRLETTWLKDPGFKYNADFMIEKLLSVRDATNEQNISAEDLCLVGKYSLFPYKDQLATQPDTEPTRN